LAATQPPARVSKGRQHRRATRNRMPESGVRVYACGHQDLLA